MDRVDTTVPAHLPGDDLSSRRRPAGLTFRAAFTVVGLLWAVGAALAVAGLAGGAPGGVRVVGGLQLLAAMATAVLATAVRRTVARELDAVRSALVGVSAARPARVDVASLWLCRDLGRSVNEVSERFRQTVRLVARSSVALSAGRSGIHDVSELISSGAETTAGQAAGTTAVAEQVSESVKAVSLSSDGLAAEIRSVSAYAGNVLQVTQSATDQGQQTVELVSRLKEASREIEQVVASIAVIAGQTRMLAFNATIEAMRAGEAGNGFAVVAEEVRTLAQATATATETIVQSVHTIQEGSNQTELAIQAIVETLQGIAESQTAIAGAVEEQTAVTTRIQHSVSDAATGTGSIAGNVRHLADSARVGAYAGAQIRTTSGELALIGEDLAAILEGFDVDSLVEELKSQEPPKPAKPTATTRDGVTFVEDNVIGSGEAEFEYIGDWCHSDANAETGGTNSYDVTPDDVARLRFTGTKVRFYCVMGPNHGIGAASVDGGEEQLMDMYSAERAAAVKLYESPTLPYGNHVLTVRVTGRWNPQSRYGWVTVDRVEFE